MSLDPDPFTARLAELVPALRLDALRTGRKAACTRGRQQALSGYILDALQGERQHHAVADAISLSWLTLRTDLHAFDDSRLVDRLLSPLFDCDDDHHVGNKTTRAYTLKPDVRELAVEALRRAAPTEVVTPVPQQQGCTVLPATRTLVRLMEHDTGKGMPAYLKDIPPVLSEITPAVVLEAHRVIPESDTKGRAWLLRIHNAVTQYGGLPNTYALASSGRLVSKAQGVHLIAVPKRIRQSLLGQLGWVDVDMRSCHTSIFLSLGRAWGFDVDHLQQYVNRRDALHAEWATQIGHTNHGDFKQSVLSFLNGATLATTPYRALGRTHVPTLCQTLGEQHAKAWVQLPEVRALYTEIRHGRNAIIQRNVFDDKCTNAVGQTLAVAKSSSIVSHILFGYEQLAMNVMLPLLPDGALRAVIFDGWVSTTPLSPAERSHLTSAVREYSQLKHGVPLDIALTVTPFGPLADPDDF